MNTPPTVSSPISLLCVDDDTAVLDVLKHFFEGEGDFSLFTCTNGPDALALVNQYQFDAVIADYSMPEMDGITLLKEIRSRDDPVLFILFTARHLAQVAIETLNSGGNYYVQKGVDLYLELPRVRDFIRTSVLTRRCDLSGAYTPAAPEPDSRYRSLVEKQPDLLCCFKPDGTATLANEAYSHFSGVAESEISAMNFFATIPDGERGAIQKRLASLTPENSGAYIEHHVLDRTGRPHMYQWGYRAFFEYSGTILEYLAQGRDSSIIIRISDILPLGAVSAECGSLQTAVSAASASGVVTPVKICNFGDSLELVQYPIFAIDLSGHVIAWNHAMADLTGVDARTIIGEGNHAYSIPVYGKACPMLIDYILNPSGFDTSGFPPLSQEGNTVSGDLESVTIRGRRMTIWSKGTAIHDANGKTIAAIQSLIVNEQPSKAERSEDAEHYVGGISSIILKVAGEGFSGSLSGAIGTATGGYGVYATDRRLFVIHNPDLDVTRSGEMPFGEFLMDELFGTGVDMRPRSIPELEEHRVFEVWRKDIASIEMKTPRLFSGFLIIRTTTGGFFRIYIDHKKAFTHLEQLLKLFYPEILRAVTTDIDTADLEWMDEVRTLELTGKLKGNESLLAISPPFNSNPPRLSPLTASSSLYPDMKSMDGKWNELASSIKNVPHPIFAIDLSGNVIAWNDAISLPSIPRYSM
ncbi:MAG: response regulator [Methanoregula sp.]|nr:response regulator [Methanoregula sp.]